MSSVPGTEVVVALDWTSFAADEQETIVLSMVTGHGPCDPLAVEDGCLLDAEGGTSDAMSTRSCADCARWCRRG